MKSICGTENSKGRAIRVLHELIALELTLWIPVIILLLNRITDIETIMDGEANGLLDRMENFLAEEACRSADNREQRLISVLSELPVWRFHAVHGRHRWNPMNESLLSFAERHESVLIFESPDQAPEPSQVADWLCRLHDTYAHDRNALAS